MGMGSLSSMMGRAYGQMQAEQQRQWQQELAGAANQPIPGLTGPTSTATHIPGLLGQTPVAGPGLNQIPMPQAPAPFQAAGPYGQQAQVLAGLLGHQPTPSMPTSGHQGLLGRRFIPGGK